ncbi:MAG: alpha-mannosidase [Candidatus Brockarchaeota archaeon]|nr:alpha-mannosidase [Candidatus Brockarchaeota archaeon]
MRTIQELEARLALLHAASFRNIIMLEWDSFDNNRATIALNAAGENFQLVVLEYKGSALVKLDSKPYFSLDGYHYAIPIPEGNHLVEAEFSPFLAFGEKVDVHPGKPVGVNRNMEALRLWAYGRSILELIRATKDEELKQDLLRVLSNALREAPFETVSKEQVSLATAFKAMIGGLDSVPRLLSDDIAPIFMEEQGLEKYGRALSLLKNSLKNLAEKYGKRGDMVALAHAHIDTAWLWPFEETKRKVFRTFSTVLTLMEHYDFNYIQSAAIYYDWIKSDEPSIFERVREKITEGKWILGAGWVEFDTQMISGESLARQLLYSQRFYIENFGRTAEVLWLPDTFGFSPTLPQAARLGGVKVFATHKVFWNDTNTFPYNVFLWIGPDNSRLKAVAFGHGKGGYNSDFTADSVYEQWQNWVNKDHPMLYSYGYGDGGGGPTEEMILRAEAVGSLPILPRVKLKGSLESIVHEPVSDEWRGELYLEDHRGVFTSHSKMKLLNRRAELSLREAETWATFAGTYDRERFSRLWKTLLKNQFHDVLPGSSIREVYSEAYPELEKVVSEAERIAGEALSKIAGEGRSKLVFNSLPWDREDYVILEEEVEGSQKIPEGFLLRVRAPSLGYAPLNMAPATHVGVAEEDDSYLVENKFFTIRVSKNGRLISIWDKEACREVLKNPGNKLVAYENIPGWADAWNIEKGYKETSFEITASRSWIACKGPLMVSICFTYPFRRSEIKQEVRIFSDSRRIDFKTTINMRDRELLVKTWFDFDVNTEKAVSDVPFGVTERPTTRNTSWEKAKYEVAVQKMVDLSEHSYGVALLNDGKYGVSIEGSSIGLSLTRTPVFPDPSTDLEETVFTYSIYPHVGDWKDAGVLRRAYELNVPLRVVTGKKNSKSFLKIGSDNLMLEAVKAAEDGDGVVLRLYEFYNARGRTRIDLSTKVRSVESLDLLELNEVDRDVKAYRNCLEFTYCNREIITLKIL